MLHIPLLLGSIAAKILRDSPPIALHLCPFKTASPLMDCATISHLMDMVQWYYTRFSCPGTLAFGNFTYHE
jgi:hypothetical protein